jgi:carbamoyl-phosphate synthase large subunit
LDIKFSNVYVDLDDTLIINDKVNTTLLSALYKFRSEGKRIIVITRNKKCKELAAFFRIDSIISYFTIIDPLQCKSERIGPFGSIFIDDSFAERKEVKDKLGIPVFAPDAVECLM